MRYSKYIVYLLLFLVTTFYSTSLAQEHPTKKDKQQSEHPTKAKMNEEHPCSADMKKGNQEHPAKENADEELSEHPAKHKKAEMTIDEFADAVDNYITDQENKSGGYFLVKDPKQNKTLKCKLEKIHKKRLASLGDNEFFVCADFKATDGNVYDIDIFMQGTTKDNLKATKTMVHKENGTPRYTWIEENGVWKTKNIKKKQGK